MNARVGGRRIAVVDELESPSRDDRRDPPPTPTGACSDKRAATILKIDGQTLRRGRELINIPGR